MNFRLHEFLVFAAAFGEWVDVNNENLLKIRVTDEVSLKYPDYAAIQDECVEFNFAIKIESRYYIANDNGFFIEKACYAITHNIIAQSLSQYIQAYPSNMANVKSFCTDLKTDLFTTDSHSLAVLFQDCYYLIYQQYYRKFMQKEYGQLNVLAKLFGVQSTGVIIEYLVNAHKYAKKETSLGVLLNNKDKIFAEYSKYYKPVSETF